MAAPAAAPAAVAVAAPPAVTTGGSEARQISHPIEPAFSNSRTTQTAHRSGRATLPTLLRPSSKVAIGEVRGQGARAAARCFWDAAADSFASETFFNSSLFCVAAAFCVYLY
eukprot:jgi/Chlat1/8503/Chrsp80S09219